MANTATDFTQAADERTLGIIQRLARWQFHQCELRASRVTGCVYVLDKQQELGLIELAFRIHPKLANHATEVCKIITDGMCQNLVQQGALALAFCAECVQILSPAKTPDDLRRELARYGGQADRHPSAKRVLSVSYSSRHGDAVLVAEIIGQPGEKRSLGEWDRDTTEQANTSVTGIFAGATK